MTDGVKNIEFKLIQLDAELTEKGYEMSSEDDISANELKNFYEAVQTFSDSAQKVIEVLEKIEK